VLADLFDGRHQLLVYHFMYDPSWDEGCPSCSFVVDNIGHLGHLPARETSLVLVSRAPFEKLAAYRERMGWTVPWYSSYRSDFNYDFQVTIDKAVAPVEYTYKDEEELVEEAPSWAGWSGEQPGTSAFLRDGDRVFHTYVVRTWSRPSDGHLQLARSHRARPAGGLGAAGRAQRRPNMSWLRRHDDYEDD
jgi:predicted dithiol-disulfide oxidoreductase (DUF899 family)